ncbi:response regulator transcription factor [Sulfurimonas sp. NWX79]|uniref:response regulator transcription factor n=1 Tax=Sulfurimonas sp. NWX79 TaxID=2925412 RepID=UPI0032046C4A
MYSIDELLSKTKKMTILYAEDDLAMRESTAALFDNFFSYVYVASDGREALELYQKHYEEIGLVVSDILMPHMDGIELTKAILSCNKEQKIIIVSAYNEPNYFIELINTGGVIGFLKKPLQRNELLDVLMNACLYLGDTSVNVLQIKDGWIWDNKSKTLFKDNAEVHLSTNEKKLLELFLYYPDNIFSAIDLHTHLFEDTKEFSIDSIKGSIKRLRKKLPLYVIKTHKDIGYSFTLK